jgi:predicted ribosome quality control (RQC) complex YloA/Tae2 family protein
MHGNRSNLVLFKNGIVSGIFKNGIVEDESLSLTQLDRPIDWSYENFLQHRHRPESIYFTFGKVVWKFLNVHEYNDRSVEQQWQAIQDVRARLENPRYLIQETDGKLFFSLLEVGNTIKAFTDPIKALHEFFLLFAYQDTFQKEKTSTVSLLKSTLHATESYIQKTKSKLHELREEDNYKIWADLLMANLHLIKSGAERVTLPDFYHDNHPTEIKLKKHLSPQDNAAIFYKKAKNQQIEVSHLQQLLQNKQQEKDKLANQLIDGSRYKDFT